MKRLPSEIDELMWALAESQDESALDDFVARYPQYKVEMTQRLKLVRGLKGARPKSGSDEVRPVFVPRTAPRRVLSPWMQGTLAFASVCFVAGIAMWAVIAQDGEQPLQIQQTAPAPPRFAPPQPEDWRSSVLTPRSPAPTGGVAANPEVPLKERPVTVRAERVLLHDALAAVGEAARIQVVISPDVPNPLVVLEYNEVGAQRILDDMARNFGFFVLDDGPKSVVILPLQESQAAQAHTPGTGDLLGQPESAP